MALRSMEMALMIGDRGPGAGYPEISVFGRLTNPFERAHAHALTEYPPVAS